MKAKLIVLMIMAAIFVVAGCNSTAQKPIAGVIEFKDYPIGTIAPDIPFTSIEGKRTSFRKVSQSIAIIGFVSSSDKDCCRLMPELLALARRFRNDPITVLQISVPTRKCPHGSGCFKHRNTKDIYLASLCDVERIAWEGYGHPVPDTVFLLDENSKVIALEGLNNLNSIAHQAQNMATAVEVIEDLMYEGG
jgi:hypothetical protein